MQEYLYSLNVTSTLMLSFYLYLAANCLEKWCFKKEKFNPEDVFFYRFSVGEITLIWFVLAAFETWSN